MICFLLQEDREAILLSDTEDGIAEEDTTPQQHKTCIGCSTLHQVSLLCVFLVLVAWYHTSPTCMAAASIYKPHLQETMVAPVLLRAKQEIRAQAYSTCDYSM